MGLTQTQQTITQRLSKTLRAVRFFFVFLFYTDTTNNYTKIKQNITCSQFFFFFFFLTGILHFRHAATMAGNKIHEFVRSSGTL